MFSSNFYDADDPMAMYQQAMLARGGRAPRRFDEYFRCYPIVMLPGPDRTDANFGGKVYLPPSALDKLTRLHIAWPMLFELINGARGKQSHAGVLEFTAEEGKIHLPQWLMAELELEPGDLIQTKSTDLPAGKFAKLQWHDPEFLNISDQRAVLEQVFRSFACITVGDTFPFRYLDNEFQITVKEVKPDTGVHAVATQETDLEVDFCPPEGWVEPDWKAMAAAKAGGSGTSTPRSGARGSEGGVVHSRGTMAAAINYDAIAPESTTAAAGARATASHFISQGHSLKKSGKAPTPKASTPVAGTSTNTPAPTARRTNGPQPLRLPPNKLFFGYEVKPLKKEGEDDEKKESAHFQNPGHGLKKKKGDGK